MIVALASHLSPDTIKKLLQAAYDRCQEAELLAAKKRDLMAIYLFGYTIEMCLTARYFSVLGMSLMEPIDRDLRDRHMKLARRLHLMTGDPHPLDGWAKLLQWHRKTLHAGKHDEQLVAQAVTRATMAYSNWRPEMRYKVTRPPQDALQIVQETAKWFLRNYPRL
jgi:hypothetical protein